MEVMLFSWTFCKAAAWGNGHGRREWRTFEPYYPKEQNVFLLLLKGATFLEDSSSNG